MLFSPTISFKGNSVEIASRAEELVSALRSLSVMAMAMTDTGCVEEAYLPSRHRVEAVRPERSTIRMDGSLVLLTQRDQ